MNNKYRLEIEEDNLAWIKQSIKINNALILMGIALIVFLLIMPTVLQDDINMANVFSMSLAITTVYKGIFDRLDRQYEKNKIECNIEYLKKCIELEKLDDLQ